MSVSERLVSVREANGYTRKRLAEELGKPYATITKYENGQREPGHDYLILISKKFGVTIDYLLGIEKAPSEDEAIMRLATAMMDRPDVRGLAELAMANDPSDVTAVTEFLSKLRGGT